MMLWLSKSVIVLFAISLGVVHTYVEFSRIQCITRDKSFADFEYCQIKQVNRSYKYLRLKVKLFQIPVTNVTVNFEILKKSNTYKPFMVNATIDGCTFFKNPRKSAIGFFVDIFKKYTNMNHSCPYDHDLILDSLDVNVAEQLTNNFVLLRGGEYALFTKWFAYNKLRAEIRIFVLVDRV